MLVLKIIMFILWIVFGAAYTWYCCENGLIPKFLLKWFSKDSFIVKFITVFIITAVIVIFFVLLVWCLPDTPLVVVEAV